MSKKIIIIGGGFGGLRTALDLLKSGHEDLKIILIDKNPYHSFTSDYYETATIIFEEKKRVGFQDFIKARSTVAIPFSDIFKPYQENIEIVLDEVVAADLKTKIIKTKSEKAFSYDWLIISLGSETSFFNIPHLAERAVQLKSVPDALNIRNAIEELFFRKGKHEAIKIVIGGGGFTGSELAGELAGYLNHLSKLHGRPKKNFEITVVEASKNILGGASPWIQSRAIKRLKSLGIKILTESLIVDVTKKEIFIKDKKNIAYDLLIWTAGVKANHIAQSFQGIKLEQKNCIATDPYLRALPFQNTFVIGDMAYCLGPDGKLPLPMTAQIAMDQGKYIARFIKNNLSGRRNLPYRSHKYYFIIPLGKKYGLADLGWIKLEGLAAWLLKRFSALRYFLSILPFRQALTLWLNGIRMYTKND